MIAIETILRVVGYALIGYALFELGREYQRGHATALVVAVAVVISGVLLFF